MKPRLTIIVPYCQDESAFDSTLVSILENRPSNCEVMVTHDGSYADPFDLSDEVRFVTVENEPSVVGLLDAAVQHARAPLLHFLYDGIRATNGWTGEPLELLTIPRVAAVAPLAYDLGDDEHIAAAGWTTDRLLMCRPLAAGKAVASDRDLKQVMGPFLNASFWRRDCIAACLEAGVGISPQAAQIAIGYALKACELECRVATTSLVVGSLDKFQPPGQITSARESQTVRMAALGQGTIGSLCDTFLGLVRGCGTTSGWSRAVGRVVAATSGAKPINAARRQMRIAQELWRELDSTTSHSILLRDTLPSFRRAA